jgi:Raf kinase inhibitor-like YbhB/YbcL family protein
MLAAAVAAVALTAPSFRLTSPAFADFGTIPRRYTCDGANVSPPLRWTRPPRGTHALLLALTDTDVLDPGPNSSRWGPYFVQWTVFGLPLRAGALRPGVVLEKVGLNSYELLGYRGPCPRRGDRPHNYVFTLYALRRSVRLQPAVSVDVFYRTLLGRTLALAILTGRYGR